MSDLKASVAETPNGFHVEGYEKIEYGFAFIDNIFDTSNQDLADCYERWVRCLAVMDMNIFNFYGEQMQAYFEHYHIDLDVHKTMIGEKAKSIETLLSIVDSMNKFGIFRNIRMCCVSQEHPKYIRIPTAVIALIDASVSIKVAVNYGNYKNRLGAYHAPMKTFLDFGFLRTLPDAQIRNGVAELIKISTCAHLPIFELLEKYCTELIGTGFGRADGASDGMLKLETPNLHEIGLDRVIAYGHKWSPLHELVHDVPLRHGHAISIDMAYSATLTNRRGILSDEDHRRILGLFSTAGLSMNHHQFNEEILDKGTKAILRTRDGLLRAAVPSPLGSCVFLNDVAMEELYDALRAHKKMMKNYARNGEGIEAFVDSSDTGYTLNNKPVESNTVSNGLKRLNVLNDDTSSNGVDTNSIGAATKRASAPEGVDGRQQATNGITNGANGHANGLPNGQSEVKVAA